MFILLCCCSILILLVYIYLKRGYQYWEKENLPYPKPNLLFGNITDAIIMKKSLGQTYTDIYNQFPGETFVGLYKIRKPAIMIRDPELIDTLVIRDYQHFDKNDFTICEDLDPIIARNPFFQTGHKWKITRSQLSHCFTLGKLKAIVPLMIKIGDDLVKYIDENSRPGNISFESKELLTKFTTDNVANCAFGLEAKSFIDEDATFRKIVKSILQPTTPVAFKWLITMVLPSLAPILRTKLITDENEGYFRNAVQNTLRYRLENNIKRNDFLDIINGLRNSILNYTIDDILGHALSFLGDGTDTSGLTASFTLFELASNIHCQDRARQEVTEVLEKHNGQITYDSLQEMTYLENCIQESLRLHPPGITMLRVCTKPYEFERTINGTTKKLKIDVGTPVIFPVFGIHLDEKYFPEPTKFDPNRFSEENKSSIIKGSYMPFGNGPRVCIGQRFAFLQIKVAIIALLKNFDIRLSAKMKLPLEYSPKFFMMTSKDGIWLDYIRRKA